jgi:Phosphotransferase enzyme family
VTPTAGPRPRGRVHDAVDLTPGRNRSGSSERFGPDQPATKTPRHREPGASGGTADVTSWVAMMPRNQDHPLTEPPQLPRFGRIRGTPPGEVLKELSGAASDIRWSIEQFGDAGGFPNGGIWRVTAERPSDAGPFSTWVKRTGAGYLGSNHVWRCRVAPDDPQWWGREAAFYGSDLATTGWSDGVRAARCFAVDDHDDCRDLWLEDVHTPASLTVCRQAAAGLARWQIANVDAKHTWLSNDWIPTHVRRHGLDNQRTLAHPAWPTALERGLDPVLRDVVEARPTDPTVIRDRLQEFPQVLTHHDFHASNIGVVGDEVVLIDWAFVGWGPIGHDAGHLALDVAAGPGITPSESWQVVQAAYCDALVGPGWPGDLSLVHRSMAVSNVLRLGWSVDHLLSVADRLPDDIFAAWSARLRFLADLQ